MQWEIFGVYGGGFGLAHKSKERFILFQEESFPIYEDIKWLKIPDLSGDAQENGESNPLKKTEFKSIINYLFMGKRKHQPLCGGEIEGSPAFAPEFYWHLSPFVLVNAFPLPPLDNYIRGRSNFLYVTEGEISFFIFAWRWLFRYRQRMLMGDKPQTGDLDLDFISLEWIPKEGIESNKKDLWRKEHWAEDGDQPEGILIEAIIDLDKDNNKEGITQEKRDFLNSAKDGWEKCKIFFDISPEISTGCKNIWLSDWIFLNLIRNNSLRIGESANPTRTLKNFIWYTIYLVNELQKVKPIREDFFKELRCVYEDVVKTSNSLNWNQLKKLDELLKKCVIYIFSHEDDKISLKTLFKTIHRKSRFPIIPFYYWTAICGKPIEHFVFPIWESHSFPVTVRIPPTNDQLDGKQYRDIVSPVVGVGLLGISPISELLSEKGITNIWDICGNPWQIENNNNELEEVFYKKVLNRLTKIATFYSLLSRPLVDKVFLGSLVTQDIAERGKISGFEKMIGAFSHEVGKIGSMLLSEYVYDMDEIFDLGKSEADDRFNDLLKVDKICKLDIPDELKKELKGWRVFPLKEMTDSLSFLLQVWGGSINIINYLGFDPQIKSIRIGDLIKSMGDKVKGIAVARKVMISNPGPLSLEGIKTFRKSYQISLQATANLAPPDGAGAYLQILFGEMQRRPISVFIRLLAALLSNSIYHAADNTEVTVSLNYEEEKLIVKIINETNKNDDMKQRPTESDIFSDFSIGSRGVAEICLNKLGGGELEFPTRSGNLATTSFYIPTKIEVDGDLIIWIQEK